MHHIFYLFPIVDILNYKCSYKKLVSLSETISFLGCSIKFFFKKNQTHVRMQKSYSNTNILLVIEIEIKHEYEK